MTMRDAHMKADSFVQPPCLIDACAHLSFYQGATTCRERRREKVTVTDTLSTSLVNALRGTTAVGTATAGAAPDVASGVISGKFAGRRRPGWSRQRRDDGPRRNTSPQCVSNVYSISRSRSR